MPDFLNLRLTGLCGIVPREKIDVTPNWARILLVDTTILPGSHGHEPHVPVLVCNPGRVDGSSPRQPDLKFRRGSTGEEIAVFFLQDQDISLGNAGGSPLKFLQGTTSSCHVLSNWMYVNWVTSMDIISPGPPGEEGSGVVKDECFHTAAQGVDKAVAARLALDRGAIRTDDFARDGSGKIIKWDFKVLPGDPPFSLSRAIAELVFVEVTLNSDYVIFKTELLRQNNLSRLEEIFPGGLGDKKDIILNTSAGKVDVFVENIPYADLLRLRSPLKPGERYTDYHFDSFYDLSKRARDRRIPYPRLGDVCPEGGPPGHATPQCPPALFEPHPSA